MTLIHLSSLKHKEGVMDERALTRRRRRRPFWMTPFGEEPFGDIWFDRLWPTWPRWRWGEEEFVPTFNFYEKEGKYYLTAELPGVNKDDVSVDIDKDVVSITGKKSSEKEEEGADYYLKESSYGSFSRSFRLPSEVDEDKLDATFRNGVLTLVMPHTEAPKRRKIKIKE
jgi:HSP20 family protein